MPKQVSPNNRQCMAEAERLRQKGQLGEAESLYRQILDVSPDFHPAYHGLGLLAHASQKPALAIQLIKHAIELDESISLYHSNLCEMLRLSGNLEQAREVGEKAINANESNVAAYYNLALVYSDSGNLQAALDCYKKVIELAPNHGLAWNNLGANLESQGDLSAAREAYARAVAINPKHAEAQNNLATLMMDSGELIDAQVHLNAAIEANQEFVQAHQNLSTLKTYSADEPHFHILKRLAANMALRPFEDRLRFHFAYAKALEDVGEYDESFTHYRQGNELKLSSLKYDEARQEVLLQRILSLFHKELFSGQRFSSVSDPRPVFVIGMPRSGTTLVEQILSSHVNIQGAGELSTLDEVVKRHLPRKPWGEDIFANVKPGLAGIDMGVMANEYLQEVQALAPDATRIVDKMTANFFYIGFIHLMLPDAKIIHVMRDPMDSCFSCYSRLFKRGVSFSYDLKTLGNYYSRYMQLMKHWHSVLPKGVIRDIHYEDLVFNLERESRKILEHIHMPWDDNCLEFHNNKRKVKTASLAQVRQPIYRSSIGRWERYKVHLQPLYEIVQRYRSFVVPRQI